MLNNAISGSHVFSYEDLPNPQPTGTEHAGCIAKDAPTPSTDNRPPCCPLRSDRSETPFTRDRCRPNLRINVDFGYRYGNESGIPGLMNGPRPDNHDEVEMMAFVEVPDVAEGKKHSGEYAYRAWSIFESRPRLESPALHAHGCLTVTVGDLRRTWSDTICRVSWPWQEI